MLTGVDGTQTRERPVAAAPEARDARRRAAPHDGVLEAQRRAARGVQGALCELGRRLSRKVTAREVLVRVVPRLDLTLTDLRVGPAPGVARGPAFTVASVHVRASLWSLLASGARALTVDAVEVHAPGLTMVLLPDHRRSIDDLRRAPGPRRCVRSASSA